LTQRFVLTVVLALMFAQLRLFILHSWSKVRNFILRRGLDYQAPFRFYKDYSSLEFVEVY